LAFRDDPFRRTAIVRTQGAMYVDLIFGEVTLVIAPDVTLVAWMGLNLLAAALWFACCHRRLVSYGLN
jgi:hypothetical protein